MARPDTQTLLAAVRRRLWRRQFMAGVRRALWGSAGVWLLVVAFHVTAIEVPVSAMVLMMAALWGSQLAWSGWRRPRDVACALWADRNLGGASGFTTWLEFGNREPGAANAAAIRRLEQWTLAKVPESLRLLAQLPDPTRLARPLLAMLTCGALAAVVLTVSAPASDTDTPSAASAVARKASEAGDRPLAVAPVASPDALAGDVARALRAAEPHPELRGRDAGAATASGKPGARTDEDLPARQGAVATGETALRGDLRDSPTIDVSPNAGVIPTGGAGAGREAGMGPDERTEGGRSQALQGTMTLRGVEPRLQRGPTDRQADMDRQAAYDTDATLPAGAALRAVPAPAAASPPAQIESARLTTAQTNYVQAWMKATARR